MTRCIGRMGIGLFAELDFVMREACIYEHKTDPTQGMHGLLATVPIGNVTKNADGDDALAKTDPWNLRLVQFLAIDDLMSAIRHVAEVLSCREDTTTSSPVEYRRWQEDMNMLRSVRRALELATTVPD